MLDLRPGETVVRPLTVSEALAVLRTDLAVCRAHVLSGRRVGMRLPGFEAEMARLKGNIERLEGMR